MHSAYGATGLLLLGTVAIFAETATPEPNLTQALIGEIRQLRQDLQTAAATVQRSQIVLYRLHTQAGLLERATQAADNARAACIRAEWQHKRVTGEMERAEARLREAQSPGERKAAESMLASMTSESKNWIGQERNCQAEQSATESQRRMERAKMDELQHQLDKLDSVLAGAVRGRE